MKRGRFLLMILVFVVIGFIAFIKFYKEMHSQRDEKVKTTDTRKVIQVKANKEE